MIQKVSNLNSFQSLSSKFANLLICVWKFKLEFLTGNNNIFVIFWYFLGKTLKKCGMIKRLGIV